MSTYIEHIYEIAFFFLYAAVLLPVLCGNAKKGLNQLYKDRQAKKSDLLSSLKSTESQIISLQSDLEAKNYKYPLELAVFEKQLQSQLASENADSLKTFKMNHQKRQIQVCNQLKIDAIKEVFAEFKNAVAQKETSYNFNSVVNKLNQYSKKK